MRLLDDYLNLRKSFPHTQKNEPFHVSMEQLAGALFCSPRNAKLIINKMSDLQWIRFSPGRGRGHTSQLTFNIDPDELVLDSAKEYVKSGDVEAALALITAPGTGMQMKGLFLEWFSRYFGYQAVDESGRYEETLKLPVYRPINTLDPCKTFYALDSHLIRQIFSRLIEFNYQTNSFDSGVAHHWKVNEAMTEWVFYLRKGIYFHHGKELDASDVLFSLSRLQTSPQVWLVKTIDSMTAVTKYSLKIRLKHPNHLFLWLLCYVPASIVPADIYQPLDGVEPEVPIGSGPFRVTQWTKGICTLEAFDRYFHYRPYVDRVEIIVVPESQEDLLTETLHQVLIMQTGESIKQKREDEESEGEVSGTNVLTINTRKYGVLQNKTFREALVHLIDRSQMVRDLGFPRTAPSFSFDLKQVKSGGPDSFYNPDLGRRLLQLSGYQGEVLHLYVYERHAPDAEWLQTEYRLHGIHIDVHIVSWGEMLKRETMQEADFILFEAVLSEGLIRLLEYYQSPNSFLKMHLNDEMTEFVEQDIQELLLMGEPAQWEARLKDIERKLREVSAVLFLTYKTVSSQSPPSLQNVKLDPSGWVDFQQIWFEHNI